MDNEYLEQKKKRRSNIFAFIFITWFVASIIGMYCLQDTLYAVMLFGQYFVVFGFIPLFNAHGKEKLLAVPFLLTGICCVVIPFFMMNPELLSKEVDWDYIIAILMLLAFLIAGLCTAIIPIIKRKHLKKVCTYEVEATITGYDTTRSDKGNTLYAPIYSFWYNGQTREIVSNVYTNVGLKKVGEKVTFKINPDDFCEYFNEKSKGYLIVVFVGILVVSFIVPLIIYVLKNGVVG